MKYLRTAMLALRHATAVHSAVCGAVCMAAMVCMAMCCVPCHQHTAKPDESRALTELVLRPVLRLGLWKADVDRAERTALRLSWRTAR